MTNSESSHIYYEIKSIFEAEGFFPTLIYIFHSELRPILRPTPNIDQIFELAELNKSDRTIVEFLNYEGGKNAEFTTQYKEPLIVSKKHPKLPRHKVKYRRKLVNALPPDKLELLKSFVGVFQLNRSKLSIQETSDKREIISSVYTTNIPLTNLNFIDISNSLNEIGVKSTLQDVLAFLSIIHERSNIYYTPISSSIWKAFFKDKYKLAEQFLIEKGILIKISNYVPGYKANCYKINFIDSKNPDYVYRKIKLPINSFRTLKVLNRLKGYDARYFIQNQIAALEHLQKLMIEELTKSNNKNLTEYFLTHSKTQPLIDDLKIIDKAVNEEVYHEHLIKIAHRVRAYLNKVNKGHLYIYFPY